MEICRRPKPSVLSTARSRRRRRIDHQQLRERRETEDSEHRGQDERRPFDACVVLDVRRSLDRRHLARAMTHRAYLHRTDERGLLR
jgi:hypothetical protein